MDEAPKEIIIPFEYENEVKTEYHSLKLGEHCVERVAPCGILSVLQEMGSDDLKSTAVSFWIPTLNGWEKSWQITGAEFIKRHKLFEIKPV